MFEFEAEIYQSPASTQDLWKSKKQKLIKQSIFEFYYQLYHYETIEEISMFRQKIAKGIEDVVWCFQIMSLLWIPHLPIKGWSDNMILWKIIGYFRIDNICFELGIIDAYLYLSIVVDFIIFFGLITLTFMIYHTANLPRWFFISFKWIFNFWANLIFIPSMVLYSIFLKYNFTSSGRISEYKDNNELANFEVNTTIQILIVCAIIFNYPLILFHTEFSCEIRHSVSKKKLRSKAHSKINLHIAMLSYFAPIFYVLFDKDFMIYYQFLLMIILLILTTESLIYLPYFSFYCNLTLILRLFAISIVSFGFILGDWMDNSLLIFLITMILGPLAAVLIYQFVLKVQRNMVFNLPSSLAGINSVYKLEKCLRHSLILDDPDLKDHIIYLFEIFFTEKYLCRDKLLIIWVTNYCLFTLKDEPLSRIKISKTKKISGNLESDFQEYLCNKKIKSLSSESTQFIDYFQQLHMIKNKDLKLCINLLKFWEEVVSSRPDTIKLSKNLLWLEEKLLFLNDKYTKLTTKFFNSKESLDLYASYAKSILFDWEKANLLENKLQLFTKSAKKSNCEFFNDIYGIFVVSCEEEKFGEILFSNPKSSEIMKSPSHSIDGTNIAHFIPSYYLEKIKEEIHRIIHFASTSEIDLSWGFFLNLPSHYLIECSGKIYITSHKNYLISIFLFKPKRTKHQIALISETGEICGYSENFTKFVKKFNGNLIGYNLKNLFPEIAESDWQWFIPYRLSGFEIETILFFCYYQIKEIKVFYVILTNNYYEIQRLKHKNSKFEGENEEELEEPDEKENKTASQLLLKVPIIEVNSNEVYKEYPDIDDAYANSEMNLNQEFSIESSQGTDHAFSEEKSQVSENTRRLRFLKQIAISSRSINILHVAIILAIVAVLGTNIAVLFYAFSKINFIRNMELPLSLGKLGKKFQNIGYTVHMLWTLTPIASAEVELALKVGWNKIIGFMVDLKGQYLYITSHIEEWNYCSGKEIFMNDNIKLWNSNKKINLLDMISEFIQTVKVIQGNEFVRKYNNSENYSDEASFLVANSYEQAVEYCSRSLNEIMECQKIIMSDFKSEIFIFLILGIGVFALCVCVMIPFWYSTVKIESKLWYNLRKKVYEHYFELKRSSLERLKYVHSQSGILLRESNPLKKHFNYRNYWKYIWRIFVYFIIVTLFSIINITYLYEKCTDYLTYRPEIMKEVIRAQLFQNSMAITSTTSQLEHWGLSLSNYFLNEYFLVNSISAFQNDIKNLARSKLTLRDHKYLPILSENYKTRFFKHENEPNWYYLDLGVWAAQDIIILDSYLVTYSNFDVNLWLFWILNLEELTINYAELADEIDTYSQSVIEEQVKIITAAFVVFTMSSAFIYFTLYFHFFRKEKQYLQKIDSMMKIIPW